VCVCGEGPRSRCYGRIATLRLIVQTCDKDKEKDDQFFHCVMEHRWNEIDRGKPKYSGKNLSTTKSIWTDSGLNPGLRGGRPATNRLSHGTAVMMLTDVKNILGRSHVYYILIHCSFQRKLCGYRKVEVYIKSKCKH
jgi:hypothetical protein